jgi:hypothetical protein
VAIRCELIPRVDASPEQLRTLGKALAGWCERESGDDGILHFISRHALADLAVGERPCPFIDQVEELLQEEEALIGRARTLTPDEETQRRRKLRDELGDDCMRRTLLIQVRGAAYSHRQRTIDSFRRSIPPELVEDILINDRTWDVR